MIRAGLSGEGASKAFPLDQQTGSHWNAYGAGVSGALKGSMRTTAIYIPPRP